LSLINSPGPCIATATTAFGGLLNPDESITNAANFNNVTSIDWTNVNFGEDEIPDSLFSGQVASVATSPLSFVGVNFSQLKDLDFKHASFAGHFAENSPAMGNILVSTATLTFYACDFSSLEELNLSGVSFASSGMSRGNVKTAESTFTHSNFSNIRFFSLGQTIFAVTGMIIGDNSQTRIVTASNSFFAADFSNVETFSTAGAVFGALHPCTTNPTSCEIDTAYNTFGDSI
jgi:uncharacterized protein YjbI with pentapeptide repeats